MEVYRSHALIKTNNEKNTAMELQCNSFKIISGFDSSFGSAVVKIYPFAILYWVNKDEKIVV